jgi:hypothetical protein
MIEAHSFFANFGYLSSPKCFAGQIEYQAPLQDGTSGVAHVRSDIPVVYNKKYGVFVEKGVQISDEVVKSEMWWS